MREPVHITVHKPVDNPARRPRPQHYAEEPRVDVYLPKQNVYIDTMFWQHRSIFAGTQEQLDELRREADERAAARARAEAVERMNAWLEAARRQTFELHRPAFRRLKPIVLVGLMPMLWAITTCKCGDRWPCNSVKQYFRSRLGWSIDIDEHLDNATRALPKPATRWSRLRRWLTRRNADGDRSRWDDRDR